MFNFSERGMKGVPVVGESESYELDVRGSGAWRKKEMIPLSMKMGGFSKRRH